jgi:hypothetical protein
LTAEIVRLSGNLSQMPFGFVRCVISQPETSRELCQVNKIE